jgi:starch phosphorylase
MKAGINGILNMSILDGWFDEAAEFSGGWAIGTREDYAPDRDESHAAAIYSLLENEIVPLYYADREQGMPVEWMKRVKQSLRYLSAHFNCQRMIGEYRSMLYEPAHRAFQAIQDGQYQAARDRVRWNRTVTKAWPQVRFNDCGIGADSVSIGSPIPVRAELDLAGLDPRDVRVEALVGRVGPAGELEHVQVLLLEPQEKHGQAFLFGRDFLPDSTGRLGFAVRVSTNHVDDPMNRPCNALLKWAEPESKP